MTSKKPIDDDEYVAQLLADDAKKSSLRYAQQGLSALLPQRPTGAAPKPNTRFLKAIVREADSHNVALKKKEELEARIRQRELRERSRPRPAEDTYIRANERPRKRRRHSDKDDHRAKRHPREDLRHGRLNTSSERSTSRERRHRRTERGEYNEHREGRLHGVSRDDRGKHRSRSCSDSQSEDRRDRTKTAQRGRTDDKEYKHRRRRSRSDQQATSRGHKKPRKAGREDPNTRRLVEFEDERSEEDRDVAYESDPLEMLVGPLERIREKTASIEKPPLRSKGRGAYRPSGAAMDAHFSSDYNPGLDLHLESELDDEKEDWDMALEALRDREMFKQKHAERLREAGFADAEIKKWEKSGKEKDVEEVKWTGKGEAREWDLGKVDQDDVNGRLGGSGLETAWNRKDGGFLKSFKSALG